MHYREAIAAYRPHNVQEAADKAAILAQVEREGDRILRRENLLAHITSSAMILSPSRDRVLFIHHNFRQKWAWTGGHADGDIDLLQVALKEAKEETGVENIVPLLEEMASLDVLFQPAHIRRGVHVCGHLHLNSAYLLTCGESEALRARKGENTAVAWFALKDITPERFDEFDRALYGKLIRRARALP